MIKTIIFDLGKVIIPFDFKRGYQGMAPFCDYPAEEIPRRLSTCDLVQRFESGLIEPRPFVREISKVLNLRADYDQFREIWSSIFLRETLIPESLLAALRARYRLLLLSNTNAIHMEMVEQNYPLLKHFHHKVLSYQVGALKPNPKIYQEALRHAEAMPAECFYTDDILSYVEAAKLHGIDAVQFENAHQIERELKARGVEW